MSTMTDWAAGSECALHDLAYCADCRDQAKIVRRHDGSLGYQGDCAVQTFAEVTGASYDEALELVTAGGYRPGVGTPAAALAGIFTQAGYQATRSWLTLEAATQASKSGRVFYVSAAKRSKGHAWSITEGAQHRAWWPPFRFVLFEVTA